MWSLSNEKAYNFQRLGMKDGRRTCVEFALLRYTVNLPVQKANIPAIFAAFILFTALSTWPCAGRRGGKWRIAHA